MIHLKKVVWVRMQKDVHCQIFGTKMFEKDVENSQMGLGAQ